MISPLSYILNDFTVLLDCLESTHLSARIGNEKLISINKLAKRSDDVFVVDGFSRTVRVGEIHSLIGPTAWERARLSTSVLGHDPEKESGTWLGDHELLAKGCYGYAESVILRKVFEIATILGI